MNNNWLIVVEIVMTFVVVVGFCVWQLRSLKKLREDRARREDAKRESPR